MRLALAVALALGMAACAADEQTLPAGDQAMLGPLLAVRDHACACKDPACSYRVISELLAYSDDHRHLRDTQAGVAVTDQLVKCLDIASRGEPVAPIDAGPATAVTGMPACDDYLAMVERYLDCDQFPQAARDSTRQATDQMRQAWRDMSNMPPDVRRTAEDACKQASDAMRQAGQAMGCDLP